MMQNQLTDLIVQRLTEKSDDLKKDFFYQHPIKVARHFAFDDFLPNDLAEKIYAAFPKPSSMRLLKGSGKVKLKYFRLQDAAILLKDVTLAMQDPRVAKVIENITGIKKQRPDPALYPNPSKNAGGVTTLLKGYFINPHLDNSHDTANKLYRTVNLLYYVSPNWKVENGGNFELWDESVTHSIVVPCFFNRLVVMETNPTSWHAVNPVLCNEARCCLFNYFFSEESPTGTDYYNVTSFSPRPEQKIRRTMARANKGIRKSMQKYFNWMKFHENP